MKIAIIDYGAGNVQSVLFALDRLGYKGFVTDEKEKIESADKIIFPGVGEASSAMKMINEKGLQEVISNLKQPVLGICLGMQLMCKYTEEGATEGLGVFDVRLKKFSNNVKVPQMGWNTIFDLKSPIFNGIDANSYIYMVHSYYAELSKDTIGTTDYDLPYSAALHKNNFYGLQFHPEKSGKVGEQILKNFLTIK